LFPGKRSVDPTWTPLGEKGMGLRREKVTRKELTYKGHRLTARLLRKKKRDSSASPYRGSDRRRGVEKVHPAFEIFVQDNGRKKSRA